MLELSETSLVIANDLRRAERSISIATRDTAQLIVSAIDAANAHDLSPAMAHSTVKATLTALSKLVESQGQVAFRAHMAAEKVGRQLGLTETSWGELLPKPTNAEAFEVAATAEALEAA